MPLPQGVTIEEAELIIAQMISKQPNSQHLIGQLNDSHFKSLDIEVDLFVGDEIYLRMLGQSMFQEGFTGVLAVNSLTRQYTLSVCRIREVADQQTLKVYRCEPKSLSVGTILVAAYDEQGVHEVINSVVLVANPEYLNIEYDDDYDGIQGEPRILEAFGFDYLLF